MLKSKGLSSLLFLILLTMSQTTKSVVFVVYGYLSPTSKLYKPDGECYKEIEQSANEMGQNVISIPWTGIQTTTQIIKGGEKLAKAILNYPNETVIIIAAEYGSNVINFASQLLFNPDTDIALNPNDTSYLITEAYQYRSLKNIEKHYNINIINRPYPEFYNEYVHNVMTEAIENVTNLKKRPILTKKYWIDKVYLLSTPADAQNFAPHMNIIKDVYNFYSPSTESQKSYIKKDRLVNFSVTMNLVDTSIHNSIVAKWLLSTPEKLKEDSLGNFENFTNSKNGQIDFFENKEPSYSEVEVSQFNEAIQIDKII